MSVDGPTNGCVENHNGTGVRSRITPNTTQKNGSGSKERPKKPVFYYGGPQGALILMIGLPIFLFLLDSMCNNRSSSSSGQCTFWQLPRISTTIGDYFDLEAFCYFVGFMVIVPIILILPFGPMAEGQQLSTGKYRKYRMNGAFLSMLTMIVIGVLVFIRFPFTIIVDKPLAFTTMLTILSFLFSLFLYYKSFSAPEAELNVAGNTGNAVYDFFVGREVNPRIGGFEVKLYIMRMGFALWAAADVSMVASQMQELGSATPTLLISAFGHALYMMDYMVFEESVLTSHAIKHEGLGFLFVFGGTLFMPVVFSFNSRYVLQTGYFIESEPFTMFLFAFIVVSHILYRFTNWDKTLFIRYPEHLEVINFDFIPADNDQRILVDGWWAMIRHPNYLADMLTAFSWCIVTGIEDPLPFVYPAFLVVFLLYRIKLNEDMCKREFGDAWDLYCKRVPYKLIKYVY